VSAAREQARPAGAPLRGREAAAWRSAACGGLTAALLLLPLGASPFQLFLLTRIAILTLFAMGFNLLFGYAGLLSFGHAAFYSAGAYTAGFILKGYPSLLAGVLGGMLAAALLGAVIGFFSVRHLDIYFSMLTLAFGMLVFSLVWKWSALTGGDNGLIGIPRPPLGLPGVAGLSMAPIARYYEFVIVLVVVVIAVLWRIVRSPFGLVLQGLRENPERVEFAGIPMRRYRFIAFVLSAAIAGLAGALVGPLENTVGPETAHWATSGEPVLASLLGGASTFTGPIVGAVLLVLVKEIVERHTQYWLLAMGTVLIVLVLGLRGGVVGSLDVLWRRLAAAPGPRLSGAPAPEGAAPAGPPARDP
jgi:branched-chain amino acid transport system permease protein